jgi:tRNA/tmRNA/rRNA uracil-C5-methylase (TrmA/RlmC/RlmD family)
VPTEPAAPQTGTAPEDLAPGDRVELVVGPVAHGGHCVARHEGRVVFVRHTLPGERVVAEVTGSGHGGRFLRADAVRVLEPSADRVLPPCPWSGPGRCGGCDFQHVDLAAQRRLKAAVVAEQFQRLAGVDLAEAEGGEVVCEPVPGDHDGLGWRTRVEFAVDGSGRAGLRRHRSHEVVPVDDCLIAVPEVTATGVLATAHPGAEAVDVVAPSRGAAVQVPVPTSGRVPDVVEVVTLPGGEVELGVGARGFWQVHPGAAQTFADTVLGWLDPRPGERALDLYAGVGLFAAGLAQAVGGRGRVLAVEGDRGGAEHARDNLRPWRHARVRRDRVDRAVRGLVNARERYDVVVLDPPRSGAGKAVVRDVARLRARAVAYVACDPAALARDTAYLAAVGWRLTRLRVLDAFPMTHHMECVALFEPVRKTGEGPRGAGGRRGRVELS